MKLLGSTNGEKVIASISHYDYINLDGMMRDGGQPHTNHYAGYTRGGGGKTVWFEVPQTFAELFADYNCNKNHKYGIWDIKDVRILEKEEFPDTDSIEEKSQNFIWGTNGINGNEKTKYVLLKDCSLEHLRAIIAHVRHISEETKTVIEYLIAQKS